MTAIHLIALAECAACGFCAGRAIYDRRRVGTIFWSACAAAIVLFVQP